MEHLDENVNTQVDQSVDQNQDSLQAREQSLQNTEQNNIARLREKAEQRDREQAHRINALEQELIQTKKKAQPNIQDDDVAEGRHIKAISDEMREMRDQQAKERDQQRKEYEANQVMLSEMRLKAELPQIEQVVNDKNLAILKERYPHLHNSIFNAKDLYERAKIAHTLITEMRIVESGQNEERANTNSRKPQSGQSGALQNKYLYDQNNPSQEELKSTYEMAMQYAKGKM